MSSHFTAYADFFQVAHSLLRRGFSPMLLPCHGMYLTDFNRFCRIPLFGVSYLMETKCLLWATGRWYLRELVVSSDIAWAYLVHCQAHCRPLSFCPTDKRIGIQDAELWDLLTALLLLSFAYRTWFSVFNHVHECRCWWRLWLLVSSSFHRPLISFGYLDNTIDVVSRVCFWPW